MNVNYLVRELQSIQAGLDNMQNCEDSDEMIAIAQELSADLGSLEDQLLEEGVE